MKISTKLNPSAALKIVMAITAIGILTLSGCGGDDESTASKTGVCGNGVIEFGEACDGTEFGSKSCSSQGFAGGTLSCTFDCRAVNTSACTSCGNNIIDAGETCDSANVGIATCESQGLSGDPLGCSADCMSYDTTSCTGGNNTLCGNGSIDAAQGEVCDGELLANASCTTLNFDSGELRCSSTCTSFDTSRCISDNPDAVCGNSTVETGELCEDGQLGRYSCTSEGYESGTLACGLDCKSFITTHCVAAVATNCGNNTLDNGEDCDTAQMGLSTCSSLGLGTGSLSCTNLCTYIYDACTGSGQSCEAPDTITASGASGDTSSSGNNEVVSCLPEAKGGNDEVYRFILTQASGVLITTAVSGSIDTAIEVRKASCTSGEVLGCNDDDETLASSLKLAYLEAGDYYLIVDTWDGDGEGAYTVQVDIQAGGYPRCGDGTIQNDLYELCDGTNIPGKSCSDLGFTGGTLKCGGACLSYDTSACTYGGSCGDNVIQAPELCDGSATPSLSCTDLGYVSGTPACSSDCMAVVPGSCSGRLNCGDSTLDYDENCDGASFYSEVKRSCTDYWNDSDTTQITCSNLCGPDLSSCAKSDLCESYSWYNDGLCDPCHLMGGNADPDCAATCIADGVCSDMFSYDTGVWSCQAAINDIDPDCGACGNGIAEGWEICDGNDHYGYDCTDMGYSGGTLACDAHCVFDVSGCN